MSKKCPRCESKDIHITEYPKPTDSMATCYGCGYADLLERFPEQTIFDHITQSSEVLAPYFVFAVDDDVLHRHDERKKLYYSSVTGGYYQYKENAIAATVAKLKEI